MYNIFTTIPSGARSKGYDRETFDDAMKCYLTVIDQLSFSFVGSVVISEDGEETERRTFNVSA